MRFLALALCCLALPAAAQTPAPTREWAFQKLQGFVEIWSRDENITRQAVERLYAPRVIYYGKEMSREAVLADKRAYIARWPERHYAIVPDSAQVSCANGNESCRAEATLRWSRTSRDGHRVDGTSRIFFIVTRAEQGKIVREGAMTLRIIWL